ncbi:EamA family transporter [Chitinophaga sp.]|uniref:DMT family transporter n=1 Tax=Chitinophaga sp. TaxID=1869181 RepID=UPI0031DFCB0F
MARFRPAPYVVLVAIGLIWGSTWMVAREALERMPVMLLMGIRYLMAGALLTGFYLCKGRPIPSAGTMWRLLPGSMLMFTLNGCLSYWSILFIPSHIAAIIGSLAPLFIFLPVVTAGKANIRLPAAMLLCVAGVALLVARPPGQMQMAHIWGYVLSFAAVLCWSAGVIFMRRIRPDVSVYYGLGWQMLCSGLILFMAAAAAGEMQQFPAVDLPLLGALAYLVVPGSIFAFWAVGYVYDHLPVGVASSYEYISILVASALGYLYLEEKITLYTIAGGLVTLTGIWLIRKYSKS